MFSIAGIVSTLADERHGPEVYESTFKYVLGSLLKVDEPLLAQHIAHYKQTSAARVKAWELKAIQNKVRALTANSKASVLFFNFLYTCLQICRPSMRKVAASMESNRGGGGTDDGFGSQTNQSRSLSRMFEQDMSEMGSMCSAVGNTTMGADGSGVSAITFDQHSSLVRYPNSMSNLRRLRCYLLASQGHHFEYHKYLDELVPKVRRFMLFITSTTQVWHIPDD